MGQRIQPFDAWAHVLGNHYLHASHYRLHEWAYKVMAGKVTAAYIRKTAIQPTEETFAMWYFAWLLGVGFAVLLSILNTMWSEAQEDRAAITDGDAGGSAYQRTRTYRKMTVFLCTTDAR